MTGHYGYIQFKPFSRNVGPEDKVGNLPRASKPCPNGNGKDAPNRETWGRNNDIMPNETERKRVQSKQRTRRMAAYRIKIKAVKK